MTNVVALGPAVLAHLEKQLASSRALLELVLRQGVAIRNRDVDEVLSCIERISAEMEARAMLDGERRQLLDHASMLLQIPVGEVTLGRLAGALDEQSAFTAVTRSRELRGLLDELGREHRLNRALMRQELQFLDHLVRMTTGEAEGGYRRDTTGAPRAPMPVTPGAHRLRILDTRA